MSSQAMPVAQSPGFPAFARSAVQAAACLLLSAIVLVLLYLLFAPEILQQQESTAGREIRPWTFDGADLIPRRGEGQKTRDDGLRITQMEVDEDSRAIFTRPAGFKAEQFPYIEYTIRNRNPASFYYFIWRTAENPDTVYHVDLPYTGDRPTVRLLDAKDSWSGSITEIGLDVYGELREPRPVVEQLTLLPTSRINLLRAIWTEWAGQRSWNQRSAHHLIGGPYNPILPRPLAMAAWAGLAVLLVLASARLAHGDRRIAILLCCLVPWLFVDMLWQLNLSEQLDETRTLFAGKTPHEKHMAEEDSEFYEYAQHLKEDVLPAPGARIFLLNSAPLRSYRRLKAQYYLLPHNVYNFGKYPLPDSLKKGDYLLVLDRVPGLDYEPATGTLQWQNHSLPVILLDQEEMGSMFLYEVNR